MTVDEWLEEQREESRLKRAIATAVRVLIASKGSAGESEIVALVLRRRRGVVAADLGEAAAVRAAVKDWFAQKRRRGFGPYRGP